jgi:hypothetical protein
MGKTLVMDMGITLVIRVGNYLVPAMGKILDFSNRSSWKSFCEHRSVIAVVI